jgi:hypothetical protein
MLDIVLGPGSISPITAEERRGLRRIRMKRGLVLVLFFSFLPVAYLASFVAGLDALLAGIWMIAGLLSIVWHNFSSPCPRCRSQFNMRTWYWGNFWSQRCQSCGLPLRPPAASPRE